MKSLAVLCCTLLVGSGLAQKTPRSTGRALRFPKGYSVPEMTRSPDGHYGVLVPDRELYDWSKEQNRVIDLRSGRTLALIHAHSGAISANHVDIEKPNWSRDSSLLLWRVAGKWEPTALVLLKIRSGRVAWQLNLLDAAQGAIITRTKRVRPSKYQSAKKENRGNGTAYPDGFTVDVSVGVAPGAPLTLPLKVTATLTSNPKQMENYPKNAELNSEMSGVVTKEGRFRVTGFSLVSPKRNGQ